VWLWSALPGLRRFEQGAGDEAYWASVEAGTDPSLGPRQAFLVDVQDDLGRFVPARLRLLVPLRGVYVWPPSGLPIDARPLVAGGPAGAVPLFSSASRPLAGSAVVRAELADAADSRPAGGALVDVLSDGVLAGRGVSDERGRVVIAFPYPELPAAALGSPLDSPAGSGTPSQWRWELTLRVRWARPADAAPPIRHLDDVFAQPPATVLARRSPEEALGPVALAYREELYLRSADSGEGRLWIGTP
jgi:hypothetical protein